MPTYNRNFELTLNDIDLIEDALRDTHRMLVDDTSHQAEPAHIEKLRATQDLLGRLHNQKTFYRPKAGAYVSG